MHGSNCESPRAARTAGPRGPRSRAAVITAALAVAAAVGAAGCQGHASSPATAVGAAHPASSGGTAHSPAPSAAPPSLTWSAARAPLPAGAGGVSGQYATLEDVSCPAAGTCVAVGYDKVSSGSKDVYQGLAETLSHGTWTPTAIPGISSTVPPASLSSVSCPAAGTCVAAGFVETSAGSSTPVIAMLSSGRWQPVKPPRPADASTTGAAILIDVSCPAAGTCVATGWYVNHAGRVEAYVDTLAGGTWTAATAPLPGDAAPGANSPTGNDTYLSAVACTGIGACVASGQYRDSSGGTRAVIDTLAGGTWTAAAAPLPADAAAAGQSAGLWAINCPAPGACVAGGHYTVRGGQPRYLVDTLSGGTWTAAAAPLPADAAADQKWTQDQSTSVAGLVCPSAGHCAATANYVAGGNTITPLIETLSSGTWTAAAAPLPADAAPGSGPANSAYLDLVACPAPDSCVAVGSYPSAGGTTEGFIETAAPGHA